MMQATDGDERRMEDLDDDIPGSDLDDDLEGALPEPNDGETDEDDLFGEPPGSDPDDPADDDW